MVVRFAMAGTLVSLAGVVCLISNRERTMSIKAMLSADWLSGTLQVGVTCGSFLYHTAD
jgi:hypothetical protein